MRWEYSWRKERRARGWMHPDSNGWWIITWGIGDIPAAGPESQSGGERENEG